jgi:peptidoglycan/xylan/chitin deacetylase (PgdA/CDA1 family)
LLAPYGITPERFAEQLRSLLNRGYSFISTDALAAYLTNEQPLPRRAVLLTFDDCYADLAEVARNVLQPSGIPALAFAVTGTAEQTNEWDQPYGARPTKLLSLDELRSIGALSVAIGSHWRTHRELPALREEKRDEEIAGSIVDLEAAGVPRPLFFAYPYGARDRATIDAVKRAGFLAAFRTGGGRITRDSPLFDLPRVLVLATDRPWHFWFKTAAPRWFERIAWVQRGLAAAPRKIWKRVHGRG